jgi:pyruvate formate lyase activating enzyme
MKDRAPTDVNLLYKTKEMGQKLGLNYIYIGNVYGDNNTYCKNCGQKLIVRSGYTTRIVGLDQDSRCKNCGAILDGVGLANSL